jgi:putative thioredoxin
MFRVQSIPAVYAMRNGQVVDGFLGAVPERDVERFVQSLLPTEAQTTLASLIEAGDELSLRKAIELDPGNEDAVVALATLLVGEKQFDEALALLERIPESERTRPIAAAARLGEPQAGEAPTDDFDAKLTDLLPRVKDDDEARQQYVDVLELMGTDDPRTAEYRKRLSRELF